MMVAAATRRFVDVSGGEEQRPCSLKGERQPRTHKIRDGETKRLGY